VPDNAGLQECKTAVLRDIIKGTLRILPPSLWERLRRTTKLKKPVKVARAPTKVQADILTIDRR
jgi:hypothetical protein